MLHEFTRMMLFKALVVSFHQPPDHLLKNASRLTTKKLMKVCIATFLFRG